MWLLGVFAALALVLAALGIYAVSAYVTSRRGREIGVRMALGADYGDIAALVYRRTLAASAAGLLCGLASALALTRLLQSLLFGVSATDPGTLTVCSLTLLASALVAATSPALRAARTDPAQVLRRDD